MYSEQNVAFMVYWQGKTFLGMAKLDLPEIQYITETLNGAGAGRRNRVAGHRAHAIHELHLQFPFGHAPALCLARLDAPAAFRMQIGAAGRGRILRASGKSVPYHINMLARPKTFSLGGLEQGKKHDNSEELEITRLEVLLDGEEKLLIDKLNFIHRVNGTDLLLAVRAQMGLNI